MPEVSWEFTWVVDSALHLGTGLSRPGYADRILRRNRSNEVEIPGDAVKGAIRLSAERLLRWYAVDKLSAENNDDAALENPVLRRIFSAQAEGPGAARYRFQPARTAAGSFRSAATAIDPFTGIAQNESLRTIENVASGAKFKVKITANGSPRPGEVQLLTCAILLTTAIGAKRTSGLGQLRCEELAIACSGIDIQKVFRIRQDRRRSEDTKVAGVDIDMPTLASEIIKHLQSEPCTASK